VSLAYPESPKMTILSVFFCVVMLKRTCLSNQVGSEFWLLRSERGRRKQRPSGTIGIRVSVRSRAPNGDNRNDFDTDNKPKGYRNVSVAFLVYNQWQEGVGDRQQPPREWKESRRVISRWSLDSIARIHACLSSADLASSVRAIRFKSCGIFPDCRLEKHIESLNL